MAIKFSSGEEFTRLIEGLADDIVTGNIHFQLYKALQNSTCEFYTELHQSPTFWSLTFSAHLDATLIRLSRVYDSHPSALNLANWLKTIAENLSIFGTPDFRERLKGNPFVDSLAVKSRIPTMQQLGDDQNLVTKDDPLVKRLIRWRHHIGAHRNPVETLSPGSTAGSPLNYGEIDELLARSKRILDKYSQLFQAKTYSIQMIGADDFETVLRSVRLMIHRSRNGEAP